MSLRTCKRCGYSSDNLEDFAKHPESKYGRQNMCKKCSSKASIKCQRTRRKLLDGFKSRPCEICGRTFPVCAMDFHHKEGTDKEFGIAAAMYKPNIYTDEQILAEINKCMVICACCHRVLHFNLEEELYGNQADTYED